MTREVRIAVLAVTAAAGVALAADLPVAVRAPLVALSVLVAPGLAASFRMGPMTHELRALVSISASVALLTVLAVAMMLLDGWSAPGAYVVVAAVTLACSLPVRPTTGDTA